MKTPLMIPFDAANSGDSPHPGRQSLRKIGLLALVAMMTLLSGAARAQWLAGYDYRKSLAINAGVGAGTGYQVQVRVGESSGAAGFDLHVEGKALNFPNDLRFADNDGTTELSHWLESTTGTAPNRTATFWVKVNDSLDSSQSIMAYYAKSAGASGSSGDNTFAFFDDFNGGAIDGAKWITDNATGWSVTGGELRGTNTSGRIRSQTTFNAGVILETKYRSVTRPTNGNMALGFWASTSDSFGWLNHPGGDHMRINGSWSAISNECNVPVIARMTARATQVDLYVYRQDTGAAWHNRANNNSTVANERIALGNRYDNANTNQAYNAYWDWVRVRKYAATAPTLGAVGAEQANAPSIVLTAPANGFQVVSGATLTATATVTSGMPPYTVEFFKTFNGGGAVSVGTDNTEPYTMDLGVLADGSYTIYATVTDSRSPTPATANSATHNFTVAPDTIPPSPDPMTFAVEPLALSESSIRMVATTATDLASPAVQYYFENITNATNSGWQASPTWIQNDLTLGEPYGYRVMARDSATPPNVTAFSAISYASPGSPVPRPVTIVNPGFELPVLGDNKSTSRIPGWALLGNVTVGGAWNPSVAYYANEAPEGRNIGDVYLSPAYSGFSQILQGAEGQLQEHANYELKVKVGRNLLDAYEGYLIQLVVNGVVIAQDDNTSTPVTGSFVSTSLKYAYNAGLHSGLVGHPIEIRLLSKGLSGGIGDVNFDDVQLTYATFRPVANHGGPYRLSKNAPLSPDGSASIPSPGATIMTYEWDLDSRNDHLGFIADRTGAAPAAIPYATLTGTYGMAFGANTIRLRITDNAGQSVISSTTVTLYPLYTYTGPATSNGNTERWNVNANWDSAAVPSGPVDVLIPASKSPVPCLSSNTPEFSGNLTIGSNSQISYGWSTQGPPVYNAMGTPGSTVITMNTGASLNFRIGETPIIPAIALAGNASVTLGSSTGGGAEASFNYPITGNYRLSFYGNGTNKCIAHLNAPNTFSELYTGGIPYADGGVTIYCNVPNAVSGNLTLTARGDGGNSGLLVVNSVDAIADSAILSMDGNNALKITMNANDTIARLVINGAQMPAGTYGGPASAATFKQTWMAGTGILTVTDGQGTYWDTNGATAGAGGATPSGNWDSSSLLWGVSPTGESPTTSWTSGRTAVFAAGSDATGSYTVSVGDSNAITVTNSFTASLNTGTSGFNVTRAGWALNGGNCVAVIFSAINATGFTATYAGQAMTVQGVFADRNTYVGIAHIISDSLPATGDVVITAPRVFGTNTGGYANMGTVYSIMSLSNVASAGTTVSFVQPTGTNPPSTRSLTYSTSINNSYVLGAASDSNWNNSLKTVVGTCNEVISTAKPAYFNTIHCRGPVNSAGSYTDVYATSCTALITRPFNAKSTPNPLLGGEGQKISGVTFEEGAVDITGSKLELQTNSTFTSLPGVTGTISSRIAGLSTSGITKKGAGTLVLSNPANSYSGATAIRNGTLRIGASNALPNTAVSIAGDAPGVTATLDLSGFSNTVAGLTLGGSTSTSGSAVTTGAGILTLNGNVTFKAEDSPLGATVSGNLSLGSSTRIFDIRDSLEAANDLAVSSAIGGTGGLNKIGFGTLLLSGNNTYTGATTVSEGLLVLSGADNSAATGGITVKSNAVVRFDAPGAINGSGQNVTVESGGLAYFGPSFGGANIPTALTTRFNPASTGVVAADHFSSSPFNLSGLNVYLGALNDVTYTGTLTSDAGTYRLGGGPGTIRLAGLNALTGSGSLLVDGRVVIANSNSFSGTTTISPSGRLQIGAGGTLGSLASTALTNNGILVFNRSNTLTQGVDFWSNISGSGVVEKSGSGMLVLNAANTYAGGTNLMAGTLRLDHASALGSGPLVLFSGALDVSAPLTLASNNPITLGGSFSFGGTADLDMGTGSVVVTGDHTITLNGTNKSLTFGGVMTNVSGGDQTLTVDGAGNTLFLSGYNLSSDVYDTEVSLTIDGSADVSISGPVEDWSVDELDFRLGSLTKMGTGTLTLSGNNNYTGNTVVAEGVLHLAGGSQISPIFVNSGGTLAFTLGTTITSTKRLTLLDGHRIRIVGTPTLDSYTLMAAGSVAGGSPTLETPIPGYFLEVAGNELRLTMSDNTAPGLVDIAHDQGDGTNVGPIPLGSIVTYTVTFNEDIDQETVTAVDFTNAASVSPAGIAIGTIMETSPGVFTVQVTPTSAGNLQLGIPGTAVILDARGNALVSSPALVDDSIINIVDTSTNWLVGTDIVDDRDGADIHYGNPVIYTIYFGRDVDHTTVDSTDFGNLGSSNITIGAIVETSPGVVTVEVTPTTPGILRLQVIAGAVLKDSSGVGLNTTYAIADDTFITVIDGTPPTLAPVAIVDNKGGGATAANAVVTYTVTFSEDMDASTVTAADFGNAGSSTVIIGSVTETAPGVFSVQATPTTAGTLQLEVVLGAVLTDLAGNNLDTQDGILDDTVLTVDGTLPTLDAASIVDNMSGAPIKAGTLVTYTVTFSEDMDASTVTTADFGNAGASLVTISSVVETTPGVFTVQATPTSNGTLRLRVNASAVLKDVAGNNLNTTSAIADDTTITVDGTAPTLATTSIVDDKGGARILPNTLVTYTLTFSEDMDASTVAADDFNNAGTSAVTIGTVVETTPGVFTVQATPTTAGTLQLRVKAGAVLKDVLGNNLNTATEIRDNTIIVVDGAAPTLSPTAIVDNKGGVKIMPGTLVTYTVTFSEDMDASTVTAADFSNAGTSTITFGTVTRTAEKVFSVKVTPATAGTLRLRVNAGADLKDLVGNSLNTTLAILDDTTITVDGTVPTLAPTSITDNKAGGKITPNTLVTYTVKFSEDMNTTTVNAVDFGNAGTSLIKFGTITKISAGVYRVLVTPTTAGTLRLRVNAGAVLKDVAGNSLNTASAINDNTIITVDGTPPTLLAGSIVDNKGGAAVTVNTLVTYTVTFSEDMNASTVTLADFGNAGTAKVTIGTVTEPSPGVFTVPVKPTTAGTLRLRVNAGAVLKDVAGNNLNTGAAILDNTTITVKTTLSAVAGMPAGDTSDTFYTIDPATGLKYLAIVIHKSPGTESQPRTVEVSGNLIEWFSGSSHTTVLSNDVNTLVVRDNTPVTTGVKRYIRLKP